MDPCFSCWRRHLDSNLGIKVLQTCALPLGYAALKKLAGVEGFEPSHDGIRIRCLTAWRYPNVWYLVIIAPFS